jgi:ketosteroid isomerase-like protein
MNASEASKCRAARVRLMGSANLDLVRSIFAAHERGDYSSVEWADPEIEYVVADGPSPGSWVGRTELVEGFRDWLSAWDDWRVQVDEYRELDGERVFILIRRSGRGKTSRLELGQLQTEGANVFHIHGGKVTRIVTYWDRERALADLDLASPHGSA